MTERAFRILSPIALLAIWELVVRAHILDPRFFPAPSCALNQRGCLPRPDQVCAGSAGFRYLGNTGG